jgi:hypothetical protein
MKPIIIGMLNIIFVVIVGSTLIWFLKKITKQESNKIILINIIEK